MYVNAMFNILRNWQSAFQKYILFHNQCVSTVIYLQIFHHFFLLTFDGRYLSEHKVHIPLVFWFVFFWWLWRQASFHMLNDHQWPLFSLWWKKCLCRFLPFINWIICCFNYWVVRRPDFLTLLFLFWKL
jgi:hypothetical protein